MGDNMVLWLAVKKTIEGAGDIKNLKAET